MMKRLSNVIGFGVMLMLAVASPSLAAKPKKTAAQPQDTTPVVTPDTTPPPAGTAAPTGSVQVSAPGAAPTAPAPYTIPVGGAQAQAQVQTVASLAPLSPARPAEPAVIVRADQCLRANAERVVRAEPSAKLATDLLLTDVCSDEVDAASLYARNVDALARFNPMSERGGAGLSTAHVDEATGQIVAPPNVDVSTAVEAAERGALNIAPNLRKYAAELVLTEKLRLAAPANHPAPSAKKGH